MKKLFFLTTILTLLFSITAFAQEGQTETSGAATLCADEELKTQDYQGSTETKSDSTEVIKQSGDADD